LSTSTWPQPPDYVRQLAKAVLKNPAVLDQLDVEQLESDLLAEHEQLEEQRSAQSALYWLQNHTATENKHHEKQGLPFKAPLPRKSYFKPLFQHLKSEKRLFVPKSREMITSLCVLGYGTHAAQWRKAEVVVQCDSEDKAKELVGHGEVYYENQPSWLKKRHPLQCKPSATALVWKDGGRLIGLPSGEHKIRLYHPTIYILDECAFLPEAEGCFNYASPVCQQIIGISSAGPGWFGTQCARPV
jgi:hypothetical protein